MYTLLYNTNIDRYHVFSVIVCPFLYLFIIIIFFTAIAELLDNAVDEVSFKSSLISVLLVNNNIVMIQLRFFVDFLEICCKSVFQVEMQLPSLSLLLVKFLPFVEEYRPIGLLSKKFSNCTYVS